LKTIEREERMMKRFVVAAGLSAVVLLAAMCTSASAQAPILDGQWFKLNAFGRGYAIGMDESIGRWNGQFNAYMHVMWDAEDNRYAYEVVCEIGPGMWVTAVTDGSFPDCINNYCFLPDAFFIFTKPDGSFIYNYTTSLIKAKISNSGDLKNASFRSLGSEVFYGLDSDNATLLGRTKVKGRLVDEEDLPFDLFDR